jgi:hypothetical protein|nr:MAG TPA: hypothetical protein [Caudoviricetes sp.]
MDIDEINEHIRKLKCEETSWQSVNKLAALCTVRDELEEKQDSAPQVENAQEPKLQAYSTSGPPQSEFVEAASAAPFGALMDILDEHMSAIKLVYPKEYELVMRKIRTI